MNELPTTPTLGDTIFALFCANLQYFCPHIPVSTYRDFYTDFMQWKSTVSADQLLDDISSYIQLSSGQHTQLEEMKQRPGIILTFHTGAYRVLPRLLCELGFNIALLVSSKVRAEQMGMMHTQHSGLQQIDAKTGDFILLDAEQESSLLQVRKALRDGYHVLVYADGNTGSRSLQKESRQTLCIPLYKGKIIQRTAMAVLSYRWQVPIYPMLVHKVNKHFNLTIAEALMADSAEDNHQYSKRVYDKLYGLLTHSLAKYGMMWEGWVYAWCRVEQCVSTGTKWQILRHIQNLWPVQIGNSHYLIHSRYLDSRLLSKKAYQYICFAKRLHLHLG